MTIKLLEDMETAEKASLNMDEVDQSVRFQGLVQIRLKENMDGTHGIPVMVDKGEIEEVAVAFQVPFRV